MYPGLAIELPYVLISIKYRMSVYYTVHNLVRFVLGFWGLVFNLAFTDTRPLPGALLMSGDPH